MTRSKTANQHACLSWPGLAWPVLLTPPFDDSFLPSFLPSVGIAAPPKKSKQSKKASKAQTAQATSVRIRRMLVG
jgi:hypothetical protein